MRFSGDWLRTWQRISWMTLVGVMAISGESAIAQSNILPDTSLGNESSQVRTNVEVQGNPAEIIEGGAQRGVNLFHSFEEFNVENGRGAYFANPAGIENIFGRVTGANPSEILGTLGVSGNADLFLINPNGIIFGENARLDLGGSFWGSAASSILFESGFGATDPETPPLLTVNIPIGLGFQSEPGDIINRSTVQNSSMEIVGLEVIPGKNITLLGGKIKLDNGNITARGGKIKLGGLTAAGTVGIDNGSLNPEDRRADITLSNAADIDVRGSGGSIEIEAGSLTLEDGEKSSIRAGITNSDTVGAVAGNINLNADRIAVDAGSIANLVEAGGVGNGGNINITTTDLSLTNGGRVETSTFGRGDSGVVTVNSQAIALTQQALYRGQAVNDPSLSYRWQLQLGRLQQQAGENREAIAAYTAAVNNLQALRQNLVALNTQVQFDFRQRVEPAYRELVDLLLRSQPSQADLVLARQTIESLQLIELENFLRQACLEPRSEIDELVENDTTAVIYPIILEDRLEIIVKLPQTPLSHFTTVVTQKEFDTTVTTLRTDLLDVTKTASVQQQSQQLYTWLIEPLSTALAENQIDTLVFVLDGSLRNIPMSVLYDRQQQQYLIEQYALAIAPGLQLVQTPPPTPSKLNVLTAGISQSVTVAGRDFTSLTNVKQELEQIQSEVADSKQLIDRDFTLKNLQQQLERSDFPVVHLATHGKFSSNPEQTFLLTWNQLLTTQELANLLRYNTDAENTIELLVMSACETATGDPLAALGLAGIAARAGVSSTVASLWFADDQYSFQVMNIFYRELSQGTTKAKALQKAQIAVLKAEPRPYLWSPFILLGNWL